MATLALEIVDSGICVASDPPELAAGAADYPGFARLDGDRVLTGLEARRQWRRHPRRVHHRFWERLDTSHLEPPLPRSLTRADLAHAQLAQIWADFGRGIDEVLFAVPGSFDPDQLALLLGVARACGMPVRGLVDAAVAAAPKLPDGARILQLDLHLHRAVVSEVLTGSVVERGGVEIEESCGRLELEERVARSLARSFLRRARFDPLHDALAEQALFDRLPEWLESWARGESVAAAAIQGKDEVTIEVPAAEVETEIAPLLDRLVQLVHRFASSGDQPHLVLTSRAAAIPGLHERLQKAPVRWHGVLPPGSAARGALEARDSIRSDGPDFTHVLRLGAAEHEEEEDRSSRPSPPARGLPHLLFGSTAHPIPDPALELLAAEGTVRIVADPSSGERANFALRRDGQRVFLHSLGSARAQVNARTVSGATPLQFGDRLRLAECEPELVFIAVVPDG